MGSPGDTGAQNRARWRGYFAQQLTGGDPEIDAATEAAMRALERGAGVNEIVAAGIEGARAFRTYGALPAQSSAEATAEPQFRNSAERGRPVQQPGIGSQASRGGPGAAQAGISPRGADLVAGRFRSGLARIEA
jgi:hypothetical protein